MTKTMDNLPISPQLYQQTLEHLHLRSVCLEEVQASCDRDNLGQVGVTINISDETFERQTPTQFLAYVYYHLTGLRNDTMTLRLDARYCLIFDADSPVPPGFFEVFRNLNLKLTTLPYFRELVASLTGRMELPTLTLPYNLFIPNDQEEEPVQENVTGGHNE